jgi:hypothetical protein
VDQLGHRLPRLGIPLVVGQLKIPDLGPVLAGPRARRPQVHAQPVPQTRRHNADTA